ncbi:DNA-binding protein [Grosmannia clavigera kw1407]|uniref:DNA-binding protein n=1 Tax=Grosmannia clavigera (strain kw1407 / UAMH 11150) TaxID=655863 RepID=F0XME1_GROCL|nr:DNA-binding protein [Grosmannia clavigera kw1407]EFX01205.1 DNA-binding protein [Grosmannia clavigera kw1407]
MADYSSLKVPELKKLLSERGLTVNGNKADLIARLQENDAASKGGAKAAAEDEIDWDDEQPTAKVPAAAAAAVEAKAKAETTTMTTASEPTTAAAAAVVDTAEEAVPAAAVVASDDKVGGEVGEVGEAADAVDAGDAEDTTASVSAPAAAESEVVPGLSQHLAATDADEEARRRAARAKRFGIVDDADVAKKTERAARFGIDQAAVKGLDAALPDRPRKRGADGIDGPGGAATTANGTAATNNGRGNKRVMPDRRSGAGRDGRAGGRGGRGGSAARGHGNGNGSFGGQPKKRAVLDDPVERKKAEERAKRFAS